MALLFNFQTFIKDFDLPFHLLYTKNGVERIGDSVNWDGIGSWKPSETPSVIKVQSPL
jgi:hypothetical protein